MIAQDRGEALELEVVSVDTSTPGMLRLRLLTPTDHTGSVAAGDLQASIAGEPADATIQPAVADSMQVALVIDVSGSMRGEAIASARDSVADFVSLLPPSTEIAVISFGSTAEVVQGATLNRDPVLSAIDGLEAVGETSLYDGVLAAIQLPADAQRLPVVVLSDGGDTTSAASLDQVLDVVAASPHRIYGISLQTDESNPEALVSLAETSGGQVVAADSPAKIAELYATLAESLASEYEVTIPIDREGPATIALQLDDGAARFEWSGVVDLPEIEGHAAGLNVVAVEPATRVVPEPGLLAGPNLLGLGAGLVAAAFLALVVGWLGRSGSSNRPRRRRFESAGVKSRTLRFADLRRDTSQVVETAIRGTATDRLAAQLDSAGLKLRVGEMILINAGSTLAAGLLGLSTFGLAGLVAGIALGLSLPRLLVRFRCSRRAKAFERQLPDILVALANVMKVGYSMNRGLAAVAREAEEPAKSELNRAVVEARVGGDLVNALHGIAERMGSVDLGWVVDAISINITVGGELASLLERAAETVRSRATLRAQVAALTAEGRMSASVLLLLPPALTTFIAFSNPQYFDGIWAHPASYWLAGASTMMLVVGGLWIKKMVNAVG